MAFKKLSAHQARYFEIDRPPKNSSEGDRGQNFDPAPVEFGKPEAGQY